MNILSNDFRGMPYENLVSRIPPGFRFACSPVAVGVGLDALPEDVLVGVNCGMLHGAVGLRPQTLSTNVNSRIQYMFRSRLDKGQKVPRTVRCEACNITLNSEQQAKQHFDGKFHQRKLRQQAQRSGGDECQMETTKEHRLSAGTKRKRNETLDEGSIAAAKQCRKEDLNETLEENLNTTQSNISAETTNIDVKKMALEKVTITSPMTENEDKEEDSKDSLTLSESKVIQVNKINQKQLEISIEMKRTYHNNSTARKLVSEAIALSVPGLRPTSQLTPMSGHGFLGSGGVLVVPPSIRPSYSVSPWQSCVWLPQVTHLQNFGHPNVAFNPSAVYVAQNSKSPVITVMTTTAPQPIVGGRSLLQPEIGITSFPDFQQS